MFLYKFHVPGELNYRFIEASSEQEAEMKAAEACSCHSFLGGPVLPPVNYIGEIVPGGIKLPSGKVIEDNF